LWLNLDNLDIRRGKIGKMCGEKTTAKKADHFPEAMTKKLFEEKMG